MKQETTTAERATSRVKLPENIELSGPFYNFSTPYGIATCFRDEWYVSRVLTESEQKTPMQRILGATSLGKISRSRQHKEYVINQLYPRVAFTSLQKTIDYLIEHEGKLVFCT